jgi:hypothetical protein
VPSEPETTAGHRLDIAEQTILIIGPEVRGVDHVVADNITDFLGSRGYVQREVWTSGVRKQDTRTSLTRFGGYVPGTPRTTSWRPWADAMSHTRCTLTDRESAIWRPSYE